MAFKMKGNPAKMGVIKGTAGHSSAMKMKMEKDSAAKMKKEAAMKMKSPMEKKLVGDQNNLPEELKAKIEASPAKQEGPTPEKNPDLMKGEMEGTYVYEGKDIRERIIDLEDRAGFLTNNDIPDLEDSKDPKDIKRVKQLRATVKKLQNEANILRNRKPNKK